jgi:hypothetical protein
MEGVNSLCDLPPAYRIMDFVIPFVIPGFEKHCSIYDFTLAPEPIDSKAWFDLLKDRVCNAIGKTYLPVCRASDGEFMLLFGSQPPSLRWRPAKRLVLAARGVAATARRYFTGFRAATAIGVSSGEMSWREWQQRRLLLSEDYRGILAKGVLALHLNVSFFPYQEHYFPALGKWLDSTKIKVTPSNYAPFYFVYALLRGPCRGELFAGRNVLVVHSAEGEKRERIRYALRAEGVATDHWVGISASRSFEDRLDLSRLPWQPDLCVVGAGVGKAAVMRQLECLNVPCIDAGFVFETWADPEKRWDRACMAPDDEYDLAKVRFLTEEVRAFARASSAGDRAAMSEIVRNVRRVNAIREL